MLELAKALAHLATGGTLRLPERLTKHEVSGQVVRVYFSKIKGIKVVRRPSQGGRKTEFQLIVVCTDEDTTWRRDEDIS